MRADRLEAYGEQVVGGKHAPVRLPVMHPEGLDGLDAPPRQVLGHALHEHAAQAPAGEFGQHMRRHEQDRVPAHRAGREGDGPRHIRRRRIQRIPGRSTIDINNLPAAAPFEQHGGNPGFFFQARLACVGGARAAYWIQFPEHAAAAPGRQIIEIIQRNADESARHLAPRVSHGPIFRDMCAFVRELPQPHCAPGLMLA